MTILEQEQKKVCHLVCELLSYAIREKSSHIQFSVDAQNDTIEVTLREDGKSLSEHEQRRLKRLLEQPRRGDIEEYYGQLLGHGTVESGLSLIGMMTDEVEIDSSDTATTIRLWRKVSD